MVQSTLVFKFKNKAVTLTARFAYVSTYVSITSDDTRKYILTRVVGDAVLQ